MKRYFLRLCSIISTGAILLADGRNALHANPTGGVVSQGSATFSSSGSQFNINQSSQNALFNWQSFNIGSGETVNFNQPSSTSVAWNQINDPNPSQILGSLNANGYVILQNSSGFYVGGQASITAHGLIMTTASTPTLNLSSSGPWSFNAPPPTAKIVNYGQINIAGGGSAFLIANDIENNGTISAPGGKIGLYAGQTVLVSTSPDGRGLSAEATVPQGVVDNNGNLVADGGSIALHAQMVNQNGLIQANSAQNVNGTIELLGGGSVDLGANSVISARGDTQGTSAGGSITIQSGNNFSDQTGSTIDISGGAQGGNGGQIEISAPQMAGINSTIHGQAADGFSSGLLTIDPANVWLASANTDSGAPAGYTVININSYSGLSVDVSADNNITLNTPWIDPSANLSLSAGNSITLNDGTYIQAGTLTLTAGTAFVPTQNQLTPASGADGIYLTGSAYLQTQSGDINLWAANEVIVNSGAIRTVGGGNIGVTTQYGDVNCGINPAGYDFLPVNTAPYYVPDPNLGGISTAAGGNVTITAGGNVISYPASPTTAAPVSSGDPGTGAFDPTRPGNVTIAAGGSVYGHFVEANGTGTIVSGQNIGDAIRNVSLSLVNGGWNLDSEGDIYLQEVRNPNGVFDNQTYRPTSRSPSVPTSGNHFFDYNPQAWVDLTAGNAVYITGYELPRPNGAVPMLLPPILGINAGAGGVVLETPTAVDANQSSVSLSDYDITLFPSPYQGLDITTTGGGWLSSGNADGSDATLLMSDSGYTQWFISNSGTQPFSENDHAAVPLGLNNYDPVTINLSGSQMVNTVPIPAGIENIILQTDKATQINVAGDMIGCTFYGENLHPGDVTSINVGGQIYSAGSFNSITLAQGFPTLPLADTPLTAPTGVSLSSWYLALALAINPGELPTQSLLADSPAQLLSILNGALAFGTLDYGTLAYNPNTGTLTAIGPLSSALLAALQSPTLTVVRYGPNGIPLVDQNQFLPNGQPNPNYGHFVTDTIAWTPADSANFSQLSSLYTASQGAPPLGVANSAYVVGGSGQFDITAGSIFLGNSRGILSVGSGTPLGRDYSFLAPYITSGANINVIAGYLEMPASTIASFAGGSVTVHCTGEIPGSPQNANGIGVSMDLGSQDLMNFEAEIMNASNLGLGIYSTAGGDVNVTAEGTINVDSSRIATFDGGNIYVESENGDVNAGSGGSSAIPVNYYAPGYSGNGRVEFVPANGIVASTLTAARPVPPGADLLPGNITVTALRGSIYADLGGISQQAFGEVLSGTGGIHPTITLTAGSAVLGTIGDIVLGTSGVIGVNVVASATGTITGLIISQQNADINAAGSFAGTVLSGGKVTLSGGGSVSGLIVAVGGVNTSGGGNITANVLSSSVNGGAGTLATSSSASSTGQSAAGQTSTQNQQQVASNSNGNNDDKKKKKTGLTRTVGRVTVILPKAS